MNDNVHKWVGALRSGKYKQGRGYLKVGDKFCCLGVACDIYPEDLEVGELPHSNGITAITYNGNSASLPAKVCDWLDIRDSSGMFSDGFDRDSLADMNDRGFSFNLIADKIEEQPKGLFKENLS